MGDEWWAVMVTYIYCEAGCNELVMIDDCGVWRSGSCRLTVCFTVVGEVNGPG